MAESEAFHGFGSLFKVGDGASPEAFVTVAELFSIQPGAMSAATIVRTHHESPDAHAEKLPGLKDTAAFTIQGNYIPANATQKNAGRGLLKLWKDRTIFNFQVVCSDAATTTWEHTGFVSSITVGDLGLDDKVTFTAEITPTKQATTIP